MTNWPSYRSHKIVQAARITRIENPDVGTIRLFVGEPGGPEEQFNPTVPAMAARAKLGDYAVIYPSLTPGEPDFKSISPAAVFDEGYSRAA